MQATVDRTQREAGEAGGRARLDVGAILVIVGIATALVSMIGDLLSHTLNPAAHAHEELITLGGGNNPWHVALFAGIVLATIGGIRWASRLGSDAGSLLATGMIFLLITTLAVGGWSGWKAANEPTQALAASSTGTGSAATAAHPHGTTGAPAAGANGTSGASTAGEGSEGQSVFGGHSHGAPGPTTPAQAQETATLLAKVKAATAKYKSIDAAKADGYRQVTQFIPGLGLHLANIGALYKGFDPVHPNILLYEPTGSGGVRLVGVAYSVPQTVSGVPPVGFPGGKDVWHYHQNLCFVPGGAVTITPTAAACKSRHGVFQAKTSWLLHAWIWQQNPGGVFTEYNPKVF